jgi:N-methylhydantoinase B
MTSPRKKQKSRAPKTNAIKANAINPVTYEVVRSRLLAITEEMRIALQSVSGSPTVTEASDFFTGLFLPDGSFASMGLQVSFQASVVGHLIRAIAKRPHLSVRDGDMFCGNDPFVGALHQNDVQLTGPIFADGEIVAWAGVECHVTDIGGMDFASWSPKARDARQEGLRIPCVKLVEQGELREDILEMILTATRLPAQLGLDFRAFIATINVARQRLGDLMKRYGAATVVEVMHRMIAVSEQRMRARLAELPDGEFHATDFLEHDGHSNALYKLDLHLTKRGQRLTFDFSGSSKQAPGFINCTRSGLVGAVTGSLLPMLAYDIPWNEGILRTIEIVAPDGLICTAMYPAPVGAATVEAIWVVSNAVSLALNRLLSCSERYRHRVQAVSDGTMATFNLGGINQYGEPFGLHLMDPLAGGYAAFASKDGYDGGGPNNCPVPCIADVERNEQAVPLFYFYRRLARDTGGAGTYRGGLSSEVALTLSGIEAADALIMTHGAEVPNTTGLFGGYPGATVIQRWGEQAAKGGVLERDITWQTFGPKPGLIRMKRGDVFAVSWQGGGGFGDPLERDPEAVLEDMRRALVSEQAASEVYGVVITRNGVDHTATQQRRGAMRRARVGTLCEEPDRFSSGQRLASLGDRLFIVRDKRGVHVVSPAGFILSTGSTRWRAGAVAVPMEPPAALPIHLHENLAMTAYCCPATGALLSVDVHEKGCTPADDIVLDLSALVEGTAKLQVRPAPSPIGRGVG